MSTYQVTYKVPPTDENPHRSDAYCVYVDDLETYKKWIDNEEERGQIALVSFVGTFDVFHSDTGTQGQWTTASKSQLSSDFETENKDEAIKKILLVGHQQNGDRLAKAIGRTKESAVKNAAQSGGFSVSSGASHGGAGGR